MSLGQIGLVFLCVLVACIIGVVTYASYLYFYQDPRIARYGFPVQEARLIPALPMSVGPTVGLFLFAWTARASIHWIVPTIGITIYGATVFIVMQCIFVYIPLSYPAYAASLFAANDFFRSALACGSVLFAHPLFENLGVARGTSLLGGLSVIGIIGIWLLYFYGARLRALSKFAVSTTETF
jgi:MFS transporter, DHA1 family, multidrug resistance protein